MSGTAQVELKSERVLAPAERARDATRASAWTPEPLPPVRGEGVGAAGRAAGAPAAQRGMTPRGAAEQVDPGVPDAINNAFILAGISFVLLILAGFSG